MFDCDGNQVFIGSRHAYSRHVEGEGSTEMRSGATGRAPLPESRLVVLRDVRQHPGSTLVQIKARVGTDCFDRVSALVALGYMTADHKWLGYARLTITQSGVEAIARKPVPVGATSQAVYESYVQPGAGYVRAGGEDAMSIKSRGVA